METREDRAARLRPLVAKKARASVRAAAAQIGVTPPAVHDFVRGTVPYHETLDKYETWLTRSGSDVSTSFDPITQAEADALMDLLHAAGEIVGRIQRRFGNVPESTREDYPGTPDAGEDQRG